MTNVDLSALRIDDAPAVAPKRPIGPKLLVSAVLLLTVTVAATFLWPLVSPPRGLLRMSYYSNGPRMCAQWLNLAAQH